MKKSVLLQKLIENKAKHDAVLEAAIQGYWEIAKTKLGVREKNFYEKLAEYKDIAKQEFDKVKDKIEKKEPLPAALSVSAISVDTYLGLTFPEDHSKDYNRAIKMMEATVYDEVSLSVEEFDAYVMNEWEWKHNFIASNAMYTRNCLLSGMSVSNYTGAFEPEYNKARSDTLKCISEGGNITI